MIKPNISNKTKNILGVDRVEQFMQRRNVEVSLTGRLLNHHHNHHHHQFITVISPLHIKQ